MLKRSWVQSILTFVTIIGITTSLFLYTAGYRLTRKDDKTLDFSQTGMISAKSVPEGASVYLNGILLTATNDTISGIEPGTHNLKISKSGYVTWVKDIEVFPELVTDITSVLISQSPRLEPLTNTGALSPTMSPTLAKLAYFSKDSESSGIRIIPLAQEGLNLFRSVASTVISDTPRISYSNGTSIEWSPDEKSLLVQDENKTYYVIDIETKTATVTKTPDIIREDWAKTQNAKRQDFIQKLNVPEEIKVIAIDANSIWSPDGLKFLYTYKNGNVLEYRVYNMEQPIPVGENVENVTFTTNVLDTQPKISWYSDSYHLILTEGYNATDNKGTISLIRIDGSNKTEIYNNTLYSDHVYSAPSGDKIIILTSYKSGGQTDLYTVSIR